MKLVNLHLPEEYINSIDTLIKEQNNSSISRLEAYGISIRDLIRYYSLNSVKPYNYNNYYIVELRPCCECLKKFEEKTLKDLPDSTVNNIQKRIGKFLSQHKE